MIEKKRSCDKYIQGKKVERRRSCGTGGGGCRIDIFGMCDGGIREVGQGAELRYHQSNVFF